MIYGLRVSDIIRSDACIVNMSGQEVPKKDVFKYIGSILKGEMLMRI